MGQQSNFLVGLLPIILIFVVIYLLFFLPQQRQQKKHQSLLQSLRKGDRVVTSGGIHGTITNIKEYTVTIRVDEKAQIEVEKKSIIVKR